MRRKDWHAAEPDSTIVDMDTLRPHAPIRTDSRKCGYLEGDSDCLDYRWLQGYGPRAYCDLMLQGWRRFGQTAFRPRCPGCNATRSLRVDVRRFEPNRSQRRTFRANQDDVRLRIGVPQVDAERLVLYQSYHDRQTEAKGWPIHDEDEDAYSWWFLENPFPTQEWRYVIDGRLVGIGYVDELPAGLSAIYFFYDPELRKRGLGTWNILNLIERARTLGLPHVYLGYYVPDHHSLHYKALFQPNEVLETDGKWHPFRP